MNDEPDEAFILQTLEERERARSVKDFAKADKLREELRATGVEVFDREHVYQTRSGRRGFFGAAAAALENGSGFRKQIQQVDDATIHSMLLERERARSVKDFETADQLREDLRRLGVEIYDRDRTWTVMATGRRGSIPNVNGGGRGGGRQQHHSRQEQRQQQQRQQQQGGVGHEQHVGPSNNSMPSGSMNGQPLSNYEISQMVLEREAARQAKNYTLSDQIRETLRRLGIDVNDAAKMWKCWDGRVGLIGGFGAWGALKDSEITAVLAKREEAKALRDYSTADKLRDELNARGIEVYDTAREWHCSDGRRGSFGSHGHTGAVGETGIRGGEGLPVGVKRGRSHSDNGNSHSSSSSSSQLANTTVLSSDGLANGNGSSRRGKGGRNDRDASNLFGGDSRDGRYGASMDMETDGGNTNSRGNSGSSDNDREGVGDSMGPKGDGAVANAITDEEITATLASREAARKAKDFETADHHREALRQRGIEVFDKEKEWRSSDGRRRGLILAEGVPICTLNDDEIAEMVAKREEARRAKNFETADRLREDLRKLGVEVFDREKYWRASNGKRGLVSDATNGGNSTSSSVAAGSINTNSIAQHEGQVGRIGAETERQQQKQFKNHLHQQDLGAYVVNDGLASDSPDLTGVGGVGAMPGFVGGTWGAMAVVGSGDVQSQYQPFQQQQQQQFSGYQMNQPMGQQIQSQTMAMGRGGIYGTGIDYATTASSDTIDGQLQNPPYQQQQHSSALSRAPEQNTQPGQLGLNPMGLGTSIYPSQSFV